MAARLGQCTMLSHGLKLQEQALHVNIIFKYTSYFLTFKAIEDIPQNQYIIPILKIRKNKRERNSRLIKIGKVWFEKSGSEN